MAYKVVSAKPTITTLRSMVAGKLGDKKAAHTGRNPQTGQPLPLPAHKKAGYRMSKTWKKALNKKA